MAKVIPDAPGVVFINIIGPGFIVGLDVVKPFVEKTIHSTANPNATAANHAKYLHGPDAQARPVSWHYTVDDAQVVQHLPEWEEGFHAGKREGNRSSIGIEICEFTHPGKQAKAIERAQKLVATILKRRGWGVDRLRRHQDWTGKDCPRILRGSIGRRSWPMWTLS